MRARAFVWLQYLLPRHWLTAIVWRVARIRHPATKDFLITRFARAFDNAALPAAQRAALLRAAMDEHVRYVRMASEGYGCDRHLLGLRCQLKEGEVTYLRVNEIFLFLKTLLIFFFTFKSQCLYYLKMKLTRSPLRM